MNCVNTYIDYRIFKAPCDSPLEYKKDFTCQSTGGFDFQIAGKSVQFDFNTGETSIGCDFKNGLKESLCCFVGKHHISEDFEESLKDVGLSLNDITAEFLSRVTTINEIYFNFVDSEEQECDGGNYYIQVDSIAFEDDNNQGFSISQKVIDEFNKRQKEKAFENCEELELTDAQLERNDDIDNAVYQMLLVLLEKTEEEFPWDMYHIGNVTDVIKEYLEGEGLHVRHPAIESCEDGTSKYVE